jgi:hypothetical protein
LHHVPGWTTREDPALSADQSERPPLSSPDQPDGKPSGLPRLHFPQRPDGQGLAPAPGAYPPAPAPGEQQPPQQDGPQPPQQGAPQQGVQQPPQQGVQQPPQQGGPQPTQDPWQGQQPPWERQAPPGNAPWDPPGGSPGWGTQPRRSGRTGPRQPARPAGPLRPAEPSIRQRAVAALILGVLSLLALLGVGSNFRRGIYLVIFALAVGICACWFGITAMRKARSSASMRPRGAVAGTVLGVIGALLSVILLVAFAAFWNQLTSFSQCLNQANTPSAQQACVDQLHRSVGLSNLSG